MTELTFLFYQYRWTDDQILLDPREQWERLKALEGTEVPYWGTTPDSSFLELKRLSVDSVRHKDESQTAFYFRIARHVTVREVDKLDRPGKRLVAAMQTTDEAQSARMILLPRLGVLAASNRSGDRDLNASGSLGRLRRIIRHSKAGRLLYEPAVGAEAIKNAIETWRLEIFTFDARFFNPHPSRPGQIFSDLLKGDNMRVVGHGVPVSGDTLTPGENGLIQEVQGLEDRGYAHYGAKGITPDGNRATISKSRNGTKGPGYIAVTFDPPETETALVKAVCKAMLQMYEPK